MEKKIIVLIPAYEPDEKLTGVVKELYEKKFCDILVVNDGSGEKCDPVFEEVKKYASYTAHDVNRGKGRALKTGLEWISGHYDTDYIVVTADADGQHKPDDIIKVCEYASEHPGCLVIGSREFVGDVPARSMVGNTITRFIYRTVTKVKVRDTQSGLRAFDSSLTDFMKDIDGDRYEYEMNVLLESAKRDLPIHEVPIETVYLMNNESSHFDTLKDSYRIYKQIFKFALSSGISFVVDFCIYSLMLVLTKGMLPERSLIVSNITARVISCNVNFFINKKFVFKNDDSVVKTALRYYLLVVVNLFLNTWILTFFVNTLGLNRLWGKILAEMILFMFNWAVQRFVIFAGGKDGNGKAEAK